MLLTVVYEICRKPREGGGGGGREGVASYDYNVWS